MSVVRKQFVFVCLQMKRWSRRKKQEKEGEREREIQSKGEETSRLKGRKKIKRDKLRLRLLLFDVKKLSKERCVFCLATEVEFTAQDTSVEQCDDLYHQ